MSEQSLSPPARSATQGSPPPTKDMIAEAVENVLARLKQARPRLESRVDRAATYLTVQLSTSARTRPIKCRIRKGGRRVYLVSSLTSGGVTYEVNPADWSCSCPDHHRHGPGCKHSLGCWVLVTANRPLPETRPAELPCEVCGEAFPRGRLIEVQEGQAEETLNPGTKVCRMCAGEHGLPVPRTHREETQDDEGDGEGAEEPPPLPELYAARYGALRLLSSGAVVPVRISMIDPRELMDLPYEIATSVPELMPERDHLGEWRNFSPRFWRKLDTIGPEKILPKLAGISNDQGGRPLALCCFEDLRAGDECHRAVVMAWMRDVAGVEVREITDDGELLALEQLHPQAMPVRPL